MLKLSTTDARSAAHQIARAVVIAIAEGELRPGDPLPSRTALMNHFGVANATIQAAVDRLKTEGIVIGRQGHGVFVTPGVAPVDMGALVKWLNEAIDLAQQDAQAGVVRVSDSAGSQDTVSIPRSAAGTLIRRCQGDRRVVEMLASPLPGEHESDGIALRELASAYQQYPDFEAAWLLDA